MSTRSKTRDQSKAKPAKKAEDAIVLVEEPVIEDTAMAGSVLKLDSGDSHVFVHRTKFERLKEDFEAFVENFKSPAETPSCPMASSCSTCSTLREENKALKSTNEDIQREISNLREENKSLITALRILNSPAEAQNSSCNFERDPSGNASSWHKVEPARSRKSSHKPSKPPADKSPQKPSKFPADKSPPTTAEPARKKSIIIAGDSIIKHLQGRKMTKQHNVRVNSFPGATVEDMKDYVKPLLRRKCDKFIVHAGTNSLHIFEAREVAEQIVDLAQEISASHPDVQVVVSGLTTRTDKNNLKEKIPEVNKILQSFCHQREWEFISNSNIPSSSLNASGIHLNETGTKQLARNLIASIGGDV